LHTSKAFNGDGAALQTLMNTQFSEHVHTLFRNVNIEQ